MQMIIHASLQAPNTPQLCHIAKQRHPIHCDACSGSILTGERRPERASAIPSACFCFSFTFVTCTASGMQALAPSQEDVTPAQ